MLSTETTNKLIDEIYQPKLAFAGIGGNAIISVLLSIILYKLNIPVIVILSWLIPLLVVLFARSIKVILYKRSKTTHTGMHKDNYNWLLYYQIGAFCTGFLWGLSINVFSNYVDNSTFYLFMATLFFGIAGAAIAILGIIFRVYASLLIPMFSLLTYSLLKSDEPFIYEAGLLSIFGMIYMLYSSYKHSEKSRELISRTLDLELTQLEIIKRLSKAGEYRDNETGNHVSRMSYSSYLLALENDFSETDAKQLLLAAPMHDIGKIGIPDNVLLKPGKLNKEEWEILKTHTTIGEKILSDSNSNLLKLSAVIAGNHHEKWDGTGYPRGASKKEIPLEARIVAICDVFDALMSERPYKKPWSKEDALIHIKNESGKHFDPVQVTKFLSILPKIVKFNSHLPDHCTDSNYS